jgi:hypothetical protein
MQEAKFSSNIKFRHLGYECQFTMRADEGSPAQLLELQMKAVTWLFAHGGTPTNGNGHAAAPQLAGMPVAEPAAPVCPVCGKSDQLELVSFVRNGKPRQALKCQRCLKWLPDKK